MHVMGVGELRAVEAAAELIEQARGLEHDYIVGVHDCTYKIFSSDWGLWKFCLALKRWDEDGMPRTSLATVALGYVPKEGEEQMVTVLHLLKTWHKDKGNDLDQVLHQVHADESVAGQNALKTVFPRAMYRLDVRHQVATIMRRGGPSKDTRAMVAANVQFALSALFFSAPLFHLYVDSLLLRLVEMGEIDMAEYLQKEVFEKVTVDAEELWTSACRCHVSLLTTSVKFRSLEVSRQHGDCMALYGQSEVGVHPVLSNCRSCMDEYERMFQVWLTPFFPSILPRPIPA